ncbi:hypothetical protein C9I28_10770 [Pseudoduganella armeniaca]|uniref:PEP-CTERM sorting domain-containing protein n=2 Tax=Pseudoduganella armeniaca TaxID=2072590 RepID=A0A2R4C954_9BURK|nr:hypothetical protein C9I28_10770 [Pseudoduganella armeniaca]
MIMSKSLLRSCLLPLLAAIPLCVSAAPVTITTTVSGAVRTWDHDAIILDELGMWQDFETLPYQMTVQSTFDPAVIHGISDGDGVRYDRTYVSVLFTVGEMTYKKEKFGTTTILSTPTEFRHSVEALPWLSFHTWFNAPQGPLNGDYLAPRQLSHSSEEAGVISARYDSMAPEHHIVSWLTTSGTTSTVSITSAVPEPGQWAMLGVGLLMVSAVARRATRGHGSVRA